MKRRSFLLALACAAAWADPSRAQSKGMPKIGYLGPEDPVSFASRLKAFRSGLVEAGLVEGRDVAVEYRWAESRHGALPGLARQLVGLGVSVIVAPGGAPGALAAQSATKSIPIVFEMGADPIALGLVGSLSRPGGNITGITSLSVEVGPKRLEFMHEVLPGATKLGLLVNPTSPTSEPQLTKLRPVAATLGVELVLVRASTEQELEPAVGQVVAQGCQGLLVSSDTFLGTRGALKLAELTKRHKLPAIHQSRDFTMAGGLMSYGGNFTESHHQSGVYAGRILKGSKPAEMPIQQVTTLEMVVNTRTAQLIGLALPSPLLGRADVVIE